MTDANTDRKSRPLEDARLNGSAHVDQRFRKPVELHETFIDVKERCQPMDIDFDEYL